MTMPEYRPPVTWREPGVIEMNIAGQWRARWVEAAELPAGVEVTVVRGIIFADDRGYALRPHGGATWNGIEDELPAGEQPEAFIKRIVKERIGITVGTLVLIGYQACKATSQNTTHREGEITLRPLYLVVGKTVKESPAGSGYERRRWPVNEFGMVMRTRYPEFETRISELLQRYGVGRAKGEF